MSIEADDVERIVRPAAPARWPWWLLRALATIQVCDVFLQPVFEGRFLSGDFAMLTTHRTNGLFVSYLSIGLFVAALVAWRFSRLPGALVAWALGLALAAELQIFLGFSRILGIHVPLGVAIIAASGYLALWTWRHHPADPGAADRPKATEAGS